MPPTILKRKHSLKGKNLFPLVKKVRDFDPEWRGTFAKLTSLQKTEDLSREDCVRAFREITGEDAKEFISMTGKEYNEKNCRMLLHCTIVHANFCGQPGQTPSAPATVTSETVSDSADVSDDNDEVVEEPAPKKRKSSEANFAKRIALLEQGQESVDSMKDKVRALALQTNPNEALLLLAMDDLARTARRKNHPDAETYEELARQASRHQASINIASLALGVVGGKAVDVVVKVLNKCVKEKQVESKIQDQQEVKKDAAHPQSPLFGAYSNYPNFPMPWNSQSYAYGNPYRQRQRQNFKPKENCYFCDMPGHTFRECHKMKMAKAQNK